MKNKRKIMNSTNLTSITKSFYNSNRLRNISGSKCNSLPCLIPRSTSKNNKSKDKY